MALLTSDGTLWSAASGYASLTTREPMTADKKFRMGSNTKTYVGTAVLQLHDQGKVNLDAPINTYLANEMATYMPAYDGNTITVRHLLNHTSGMYNFTVDATWGNAYMSDAMKRYYPQELLMIANAGAASPNAPVFGQFTYSNTNYVLLGLLLRNAGGSVYDDTVRTAIIEPLGLANTMVPNLGDALMPENSSHGYWEDTETGILYDVSTKDPSTVWSSGDMISNIDDLVRWGKVLGQGSLLAPATQEQRLSYVTMNDHLQYGLGIVRDTNANLIGHQGGMIGYTSQTYYLPDEGATIAFFYNRTLALHDYSDVMTYTALKLLWPARYASLPDTTETTTTRRLGPVFKPGFLTEY
jgi:D-alanyl-D-alanine carboxypeptidase